MDLERNLRKAQRLKRRKGSETLNLSTEKKRFKREGHSSHPGNREAWKFGGRHQMDHPVVRNDLKVKFHKAMAQGGEIVGIAAWSRGS